MNRTVEELESIVRTRICGVCTDRKNTGECGRDEPSSCALFRLFPEVAEAILNTHSEDIRDYVDAIRRKVCAVCIAEDTEHNCTEREQVRCSLDAYLILVVDAIEEATGRQFDRTVLEAQPAEVTIPFPA
jgi:hypothetical protein